MIKRPKSQQDALALPFAILESESDRISSLFDIVDRYRRGLLLKPPHQRDFIWTEEKRKAWVDRIRADRKPVGAIVTYQIRGDKHCPLMINDGIQRTSTTLEYLEHPGKYADTEETAERYCRAVLMPVQHRIYNSREEALEDFQLLNMGTALTAQEFCRGILVYMERYGQYAPALDRLQESVTLNAASIVVRRYAVNRKIQHRNYRHNLAMFHRFASRAMRPVDYNAGRASITYQELESKNVIEWKVRNLLEHMDIGEVERQVDMFCKLVERETALLMDLWFNVLEKPIGTGINDTLYRWFLDCAIWKRHNKIPIEHWIDFATKVLRATGGRSQIVYIDDSGNQKAYTLATSQLSRLPAVCSVLDSSFYEYAASVKPAKKLHLHSGFDTSHIEPVALHGDGPTIPEPASINRSRGKAPIQARQQHL